ncbi:hypothetical protein K0M31_003971 [Melipona bicolor]|uniref:Uncharacterized protein n=1 Tax=Melipona bicolor TaxID=60889 RepID=A0AA40FXX6_9HYME|nr:hypothetical protein K0M31_003971 [Melipona bicolor]
MNNPITLGMDAAINGENAGVGLVHIAEVNETLVRAVNVHDAIAFNKTSRRNDYRLRDDSHSSPSELTQPTEPPRFPIEPSSFRKSGIKNDEFAV